MSMPVDAKARISDIHVDSDDEWLVMSGNTDEKRQAEGSGACCAQDDGSSGKVLHGGAEAARCKEDWFAVDNSSERKAHLAKVLARIMESMLGGRNTKTILNEDILPEVSAEDLPPSLLAELGSQLVEMSEVYTETIEEECCRQEAEEKKIPAAAAASPSSAATSHFDDLVHCHPIQLKSNARLPRTLLCHLCGRHFGLASLPFHLRQCQRVYFLRERENLPADRRGLPPSPQPDLSARKHSTVEWDAKAIEKYNGAAFAIYCEFTRQPCSHCGKKFDQKAIKGHELACSKANHQVFVSGDSKQSAKLFFTFGGATPVPPCASPCNHHGGHQTSSVVFQRLASRPPTIVCYLCGNDYSRSSLRSHVKQCQRVFILRQLQKDPDHRRPLPLAPPGYWRALNGGKLEKSKVLEFNARALQAYKDSLLPCKSCGRSFTESALLKHAKSCERYMFGDDGDDHSDSDCNDSYTTWSGPRQKCEVRPPTEIFGDDSSVDDDDDQSSYSKDSFCSIREDKELKSSQHRDFEEKGEPAGFEDFKFEFSDEDSEATIRRHSGPAQIGMNSPTSYTTFSDMSFADPFDMHLEDAYSDDEKVRQDEEYTNDYKYTNLRSFVEPCQPAYVTSWRAKSQQLRAAVMAARSRQRGM